MLNKIFSALSCFSLLVNIFAAPISVYAQESPTPTPTDQATPTDSPTLTLTPTIEESSVPTPTEAASPSPEATVEPTATPEEATPAPTSEPEVQGTASENAQPQAPPSESPSVSPTFTTEAPSENGHVSAVILENTKVDTSSVDQFDLTYQEDGSATISTDKLDYSPTDSVLITGTGFIVNKTYTIEITSQDAPAVDFKDNVKADSKGNILYNYQLDGNYRPNYKVEIKDGERVVATTTFTDSRTVNSATLNGSSSAIVPLGGALVAASLSVTTSGSGSDNDWKSSSWRIDSGGWTCINHSNHTSSGTYTENFSIASPSAPGLYSVSFRAHKDDSCGDTGVSETLTLTDSLTVVASWPTSWTTPSQCSTDPSDESPSEVDLLGTGSDPAVGFYTDANFIYFRERVEGNPGTVDNLNQFSWVVLFQTSTPQYQYLGTISGKAGNKVQLWDNLVNSPSSSGVDFSPLFNDPADSVVWEGASASYGRVTSSGGAYFVDWAIPLSELTSRGINVNATKFFATSTNANNYNKDHLNCYEAIADLSIVKTDSPDPVIDGGTLTYTLSINNAGPDAASSVIVTDTLPAGYSITSVTPSQGSCSDTSAPLIQCELGSMSSGANAMVTIVGTLTGSGTVTNNTSVSSSTLDTNTGNNSDSEDTTINPAVGTITVHKNLIGTQTSLTQFCFTLSPDPGNGEVCADANGDAVFTDVPLGTYTASETASALNYTQTDTTCDSEMTISENGDSQSCTITNTRDQGRISFLKEVDDQSDVSAWEFTIDGVVGTFNSGDSITLDTGTYTATESGSSDYTPFSASGICSDLNGNSATLTVTTEGGTCTFTNHVIRGSVSGYKYEDADGDTQSTGDQTSVQGLLVELWQWIGDAFAFTNQTATTDANGFYSFEDLFPGTYQVKEDLSSLGINWTSLSGTESGSIAVKAGGSERYDFVNTQYASITVHKDVDTNGDGEVDETNVDTWTWDVDGSGGYVSGNTLQNVLPGTHTVSEQHKDNYHVTSFVCGDTNYGAVERQEVALSSGENLDCTFTNTRDTGSLKVDKEIDSNGDGSFEDEGGNSEANTLGFRWGIDSETPEHLMGGTASPLPTGSYSISENSVADYHFVGWYYTGGDGGSCEEPEDTSLPDGISVSEGETTEITLCNARDTNTINVNKVLLDPDGNPIDNDSHSFTIQLDGAGDQNIQSGGQVSYNDVPTGVHGITEVADSEYGELGCKIGDTDASSFTLSTGDPVSVVCTNKQKKSHITVIKRIVGPKGEDVLDENGQFTFNVSTQSAVLGDNGEHTFDVNPGNYDVVEETNNDYTFVDCTAEYDGDEVGEDIRNGENVTLGSNDSVTVACTNKQDPGTITGVKWNDQNANGQRDVLGEETLEQGIPDWTMFIDENENGVLDGKEVSTTTDQDGAYAFEGLNPGTYRVCEVGQNGWQQTHPSDSEINNCYDVTLTSNETSSGWNFGNSELASSVKIEKSNDKSGGTSAGDTATYTLTLTNDGKQTLTDIEVSDVLPGGFTYVSGSTTGATTSDPTISGGVLKWSGLGPLLSEGTLMISYKAIIASDLVDGTYTNFATCTSINRREDKIDCNVADSSVPLGHGIGYGGNLTPQVLGASTELPASGSPTGLLILAFGALGAGLVLRKRYEKN